MPQSSSPKKPHSHGAKYSGLALLILSAAFTWLTIMFNHAFERTLVGEWLRLASYDFLQLRLERKIPAKDLKVVVVDIKDWPGPDAIGNSPGREKPFLTDRSRLSRLLDKIQDLGAVAAAIDFNFSPLGDMALTEEESRFIKSCVEKKNAKHPFYIYLSSLGRLALDRSQWLGTSEAAELAAHPLVPTHPDFGIKSHPDPKDAGDGPAQVRTMPLEITIRPIGSPMPSLAMALASTPEQGRIRNYPRESLEPPWNALFERYSATRVEDLDERGASVETKFFPVNYGALESLRTSSISLSSNQDEDLPRLEANANVLAGAYVIIGRSESDPPDWHSVPGLHRSQTAGLYVHACAVWTLIKEPIYVPTNFGRYVIDFGLSFAVLLATLLTDRYLRNRTRARTLKKIAPWLIALAAFFVGVVFISFTRLLWDDFVFVIVGLTLLHPSLHYLYERIGEALVWVIGLGRQHQAQT